MIKYWFPININSISIISRSFLSMSISISITKTGPYQYQYIINFQNSPYQYQCQYQYYIFSLSIFPYQCIVQLCFALLLWHISEQNELKCTKNYKALYLHFTKSNGTVFWQFGTDMLVHSKQTFRRTVHCKNMPQHERK